MLTGSLSHFSRRHHPLSQVVRVLISLLISSHYVYYLRAWHRLNVNERRIRASFWSVQKFVRTRVNRFSVTIMVSRQHWLFTAAGRSLKSRREVLTNYDSESRVILGSLLKSGFILQVRNNWNSLGQQRQSIISKGGAWSSGWSQSWKELLLTVTALSTTCALAIFRIKVGCTTSNDGIKLWVLTWLVNSRCYRSSVS